MPIRYRRDSTHAIRIPRILNFLAGLALVCGTAQGVSAAPSLTLPELQKNFLDWRYGMFIHFNMGTFTDEEWAKPNQNPALFAPKTVDAAQWAAAAKAGGMKFAVLTTKHHDGFALWPTKFQKKNTFGTYQNVMSSGFKQDIVKLYMDAFRAAGVTPCLYFSIWDRTEGIDKGSVSQEDLDLIVGQLTELLTNYGDIPLLMFDGWSWKMGHREAPFQLIRETIRKLQPNCLIVDHTGTVQPFEEDLMNFEHFDVNANNIYAATRGTPIMAKWFWHPGYDTQSPLSASSILSRLGNAEAHNANLLLDCPPNRDGKLDDNIVKRLAEVGAAWKPLASRPPLPEQPAQVVHAVTPAAVTSSSNAATAENAIDGINDYVGGAAVQTLWTSSGSMPQSLTLDFGRSYTNIDALAYLPNQDRTVANDITTINPAGAITAYNVYASEDDKTFTKVGSGTWAADGRLKTAKFPPTTARYLRLEATAVSGGGAAIVSEIDAGAIANIPGDLTTIAMDGRTRASGIRFLPRNGFIELQGLDQTRPASYRILSLDGQVLQDGILAPGAPAQIRITAKGWGWKVLEMHPKGGAPVSGTFFLP